MSRYVDPTEQTRDGDRREGHQTLRRLLPASGIRATQRWRRFRRADLGEAPLFLGRALRISRRPCGAKWPHLTRFPSPIWHLVVFSSL